MKQHITYLICVMGVIAALVFGWALQSANTDVPETQSATQHHETILPENMHAKRIVSLSPSVTETLFALGVGDRVVGVTRFCTYPQEARALPKVGGFVDPDFEAIVALQPDLVVLRRENEKATASLESFGMRMVKIDHTSLDGIFESITIIGAACGVPEKAAEVVADMKSVMADIAKRHSASGSPEKRPRVLLCVGRFMGSGSLKDVYAAGNDHLYHEALMACGVINVCASFTAPYPRLDAETILRLDPDIIIDLAAGETDRTRTEAILADWKSVPNLRALEENRVYVLSGDYVTVPGPRFIQCIRDLSDCINGRPNDG